MTKPQLTAAAIMALVTETDPIFLVGIRGFFEPVGANKKGIYDDALFLITPDSVEGWNFNTDPSIDRPGMAVLQPGRYPYHQGIHGVHHLNLKDLADRALYNKLLSSKKDLEPIAGRILPYHALRQAGPVTVLRDGQDTVEMKKDPAQWPWIDIHHGGFTTTSSEGCQTVHPDQWAECFETICAAMDSHKIETIYYTLVVKE